MIGEDLDSGADNKHHEEHVQEVLQLQPPRKAGVDRRRGLGDAGILLDECLDAGSSRKLWARAIRRTSAAAPIGRPIRC